MFWKIINDDCLNVLPKIKDNSIDCIITDPPYGLGKQKIIVGDESLELYKKSLPQMNRVLKNNKWFITFSSIKHHREMIKETEKHFKYVWLGIIHYTNREKIINTPIGFCRMEMFLIFKKGNAKRHYQLRDVISFNFGRKPNFPLHPCQKPINPLLQLVKFGTKEKEIVLDPYLGNGSTMVACKQLRRNCLGIEIESKYCKIAEERVKNTSIRKTLFDIMK